LESIELLTKSGINFDKLYTKGMLMERFAECLTCSGLILNEDITWISFHGAYDFAYLLKILTNLPLPESEIGFLEQISTYFPSFYDVRYLVKKDNFRGSLSKLAQGLEINRIGSQHQAGSDSVVTAEIFFRLKNCHDFDEIFFKGRNVLYGLGAGSDDNEPINFNQTYYANSTVNQHIPFYNANVYGNSKVLSKHPQSQEYIHTNPNSSSYGNIPFLQNRPQSGFNNYPYKGVYAGNMQFGLNESRFPK
jgi:CCR4-NOT transcription complex subunit 7/8